MTTAVITAEAIYNDAKAAGDAAVAGMKDGYPCGFAWVIVKPANSSFAKWLKANGLGSNHVYGGLYVSSYECSSFTGQNVDTKEPGCYAFAKVLTKHGINCYVDSRLD